MAPQGGAAGLALCRRGCVDDGGLREFVFLRCQRALGRARASGDWRRRCFTGGEVSRSGTRDDVVELRVRAVAARGQGNDNGMYFRRVGARESIGEDVVLR